MGTRPERVPLRYVPAYWTRALQEGVAAAVPPDAAPLVTALLRSLCCAGISLRRPAPRLVFLVFHGVHPSVGLVSVL